MTKTARLRGLRALRSDLIDPTIAVQTDASSSVQATALWSSFVAWSMRCGAPSKCRTRWSSATQACRPIARSNSASAFIWATSWRRATATSWATASISPRDWKGSPSPARSVLEDAYRQVRARLDLEVSDLGQTQLKNIVEPVRVYSLQVGLPAQAKPSAPAAVRPDNEAPALARPPRQALDRGAAVPEHERRSGAGIFRRRDGRGHHHRPVAHQMAIRDRAQFELHLQGQAGRHKAGGPRTRRALRLEGGVRKAGNGYASPRS